MISYISRKLAYLFAIYMVYTFSIRHLPKGFEEIGTFIFATVWNFGVQWGCYRLTQLARMEWMKGVALALQLILVGWSVYAYRFAYLYVSNKPALVYDKFTFFYTPLSQYGVVAIAFVVFLFINTDR